VDWLGPRAELFGPTGGTMRVGEPEKQGITFITVSLKTGTRHHRPNRMRYQRCRPSTATGATAYVE